MCKLPKKHFQPCMCNMDDNGIGNALSGVYVPRTLCILHLNTVHAPSLQAYTCTQNDMHLVYTHTLIVIYAPSLYTYMYTHNDIRT